MILLDTDHLTVLKYTDCEPYARLHGRLLAAAPEPIGTTIVNVEEQMRGWLSAIAKERTLQRQILAYHELTYLFDFFAKFNLVSLSAESVDPFQWLPQIGHKNRYDGSEDRVHRDRQSCSLSHGQSAGFREGGGVEIRELARIGAP